MIFAATGLALVALNREARSLPIVREPYQRIVKEDELEPT
jgi:hypothetical protein